MVGPTTAVDVVLGKSVVVVTEVTVVVVATVVVVPDGGTVEHPNEPATDANIGPAPGKLPNEACSDCNN